ncbi:MAG: hypothetical protein EBS78_11560 [Altererythrobacter sp.]|jgi:hypothetical protein|nr:hypothetical protein [Altererythrobacter sp.]
MSCGYTRIAKHHFTDPGYVRDRLFDRKRFTRLVYRLGNGYWSSGARKPVDREGLLVDWKMVVSKYDGSILWHCKGE